MIQRNHPLAPSLVPSLGVREFKVLCVPAAKTATGNLTGVDFVITGPEDAFAILNVGTTSGTNPTLDVKLQESTDNSNSWTDVVSFTQLTAAGAQMLKFTRTKRYVRAVLTITGTNPSFIVGLILGY